MGTNTGTADPGLIAGLIGTINGALGAAAVAGEMVIDYVTIAQVRTHLNTAREKLAEAQTAMASIPASAVGGSPAGKLLSHHSKLANDRLLETIAEMEKGLSNYETVMITTQKEVGGSDDLAATDHGRVLTNLDAGAVCTGGPGTTTPLPQCQG